MKILRKYYNVEYEYKDILVLKPKRQLKKMDQKQWITYVKQHQQRIVTLLGKQASDYKMRVFDDGLIELRLKHICNKCGKSVKKEVSKGVIDDFSRSIRELENGIKLISEAYRTLGNTFEAPELENFDYDPKKFLEAMHTILEGASVAGKGKDKIKSYARSIKRKKPPMPGRLR